ncbi:hypothetical protein TNCT_150831 [Trichonephila clavata]|uniref:Uncharacterized protein n=1 Tax=Trichonephila clavata TaxID=2740835 RepID=A0A8X6J134_TRICU|nr:hypothetical protein TNCT_150831 [Trichonephila clavata]
MGGESLTGKSRVLKNLITGTELQVFGIIRVTSLFGRAILNRVRIQTRTVMINLLAKVAAPNNARVLILVSLIKFRGLSRLVSLALLCDRRFQKGQLFCEAFVNVVLRVFNPSLSNPRHLEYYPTTNHKRNSIPPTEVGHKI